MRVAAMALLGRILDFLDPMSALPPKADIGERNWDGRFVPKADMPLRSRRYRLVRSKLRSADGGARGPKIMCQHAECHRDDKNDHRQR